MVKLLRGAKQPSELSGDILREIRANLGKAITASKQIGDGVEPLCDVSIALSRVGLCEEAITAAEEALRGALQCDATARLSYLVPICAAFIAANASDRASKLVGEAEADDEFNERERVTLRERIAAKQAQTAADRGDFPKALSIANALADERALAYLCETLSNRDRAEDALNLLEKIRDAMAVEYPSQGRRV